MQRIALISEHASPLARVGSIDSGGQNIYVRQLARHLARRNCEVDIFTRRDQPGLEPVMAFAPGVRVIHVPAGPECFVPKEAMLPLMRPFAEGLRSHFRGTAARYDVIHANFFMSGLAAQSVAREFGVPLIITFHALGLVRRRHQNEADRFPEERIRIERLLAQRARRIIAECSQDRDDLLTLYDAPRDRIEVVPCGVDEQDIVLWRQDRARQQLGWNASDFTVLQLGRLVPRKGIDNVVRAIAVLKQGGISARLQIVGGDDADRHLRPGTEAARLMNIAAASGVADRVHFVGGVPHSDVGLYYSAADVFVTTPWYEPFGMTPLEAMICATPVIGSAVGGIRSTVVHGKTGFLVAPQDPVALAERLAQLHRNPLMARRLGAAGRARALRSYSWQRVAAQVASVYGHAMNRHRHGAVRSESGVSERRRRAEVVLLQAHG